MLLRTTPIWIAVAAVVIAEISAPSTACAGAKDESIADWFPLVPPGFNDWRNTLADKGFSFGITYIADNIGNISGGIKRGGIHLGRLDLGFDADLEKLLGWNGAKFHANMLEIYGRGLTRNNIGNLATISETEALPDTRFYEAWIEQSLWGGNLFVKVGQQAADVEFFDSQTDDLFINGTFGWPAVKASNLPAGGPAPPIAVPGVRVKANLTDQWTGFAAIFNGNPARAGVGDPQLRDSHGLAFRVNDDPWLIGQLRYDYKVAGRENMLPGNVTPGAWYHTGEFDNRRFTQDNLSIADPAGSGVPGKMRGNFGIFAVLEQTLYRPSSVKETGVSASVPGITAFARAAYSPPDRNLIDFYADGGIGFSGMISSRPLDRFGAAIAYMHISSDDRRLDLDFQMFNGLPTPIRSAETLVELIYEAHVKPGWLVQPFFQYVFRPSGGVSNPSDPTGISRIGDAAIFGLTTTLKY
jgi:porin